MSTRPFVVLERAAAPRSRSLAGAALWLLILAGCGYDHHQGCYGCQPVPPANFNTPDSIAIADVNGDGVPDLLVSTQAGSPGTVAGSSNAPGFANVILGSKVSPGTFLAGEAYATTGFDPSSIAAADLTGSGSIDLVVANYGSGSVSVYLPAVTPGTSVFAPAVNVVTGGQPNQVVIGDLNGDGKPDLVVADLSPKGNAIVLLQNPAAPGTFMNPVDLPTGNYTSGVAIGDLNGDGKPDIVAATYDSNGNNGAVYVFFQSPTSPGTFLAPVSYPAGAQPQAVMIADVNGDGLPDIIVANYGPGSDGTGISGVTVLLQDAAHPGTFLAPVSYPTPFGAVYVVVADLNGDGRPDLAVASLGPAPTGAVSVLLQSSTQAGVFTPATIYPGFGDPLGLAIADLNGDGHPDIAVADGPTATVMFQVANQPGTFQDPVVVGN
ncbi:MAG: VCBS repeat-containing protein [Steroidobacteraceae bacterium]